ncbi:TPA: hypothetical protein EYP37_01520 [Candidatus Poribacteria bacterium]|nr:hypothetical protein [Candidatus Poribacteria bacterium]
MKGFSMILILTLFLSPPLWAHKVNIFAYVERGKVYTESYFSDGTPCKRAKIEVYDQSGKKILEGVTDEKGDFSFPLPAKRSVRIVLLASMGHRAETTLSAEDMTTTSETPVPSGQGVTADEPKKAIGEAVREGINPLIREIRRERNRIRISDVIGGIGYIIGIWGTISLILSRKRE